MKFKLDENLLTDLVELLHSAGHEVTTVGKQRLGGSADEAVASVCRREGRGFITLDLDFADIRTYPPEDYAGLVVLRLVRQDKPRVMTVMRRLMPLFSTESLAGRLWIVEDQRVRVHGGEL